MSRIDDDKPTINNSVSYGMSEIQKRFMQDVLDAIAPSQPKGVRPPTYGDRPPLTEEAQDFVDRYRQMAAEAEALYLTSPCSAPTEEEWAEYNAKWNTDHSQAQDLSDPHYVECSQRVMIDFVTMCSSRVNFQ